MGNFGNFFKKHWFTVLIFIVLLLFAVIGVPFLINLTFSIPALCNFINVDWEAKDALSYYGSALGFIGTVIFSGLALWQNHIIKTESDKHTKILEQMEVQKNMPVFHFAANSMTGNCKQLSLYIENISDNIATEIHISEIKIFNEDGTEYWTNGRTQRIAHLEDKYNMPLETPGLESLKQVFKFSFSFKDKFGILHKRIVVGKQMGDKISFPRFFIKETSEDI